MDDIQTVVADDLFVSIFREFSRFSYSDYVAYFLDKLPLKLLEPALAVNPSLERCHGFTELLDAFGSSASHRMRNPEFYPYLNRLNVPHFPNLQGCVDALRIHAGLDGLDRHNCGDRTFWRLRGKEDNVIASANGTLQQLKDIAGRDEATGTNLIVYRPYPQLFADIQPRNYKGGGDHTLEEVLAVLKRAMTLLKGYSAELAQNFSSEVSTVAVMMRQTGRARSFSMRNFYVGGVFVSIASTTRMVEELIHEYYHQRLWPWWMLEKPDGLPSMDEIIVSPVTGQRRSVPVMLQALLIYRGLLDYYQFILNGSLPADLSIEERNEAKERLDCIAPGIQPLADALHLALPPGSTCASMVDFLTSY